MIIEMGTPVFYNTVAFGHAKRGTYVCPNGYHNYVVLTEDGDEVIVLNHRLTRVPMVGMFANQIGYSEVYPHEIVEVRTDNKIIVRRLKCLRDPNWKPEFVAGGFAGHCVNQHKQTWLYESNVSNELISLRKHKDGNFYSRSSSKFRIELEPFYFYDYNF
jgi:hypothetical protein